MFSKVMWVSAMLACLAKAEGCGCGGGAPEAPKVKEELHTATVFAGEKQIAPFVKSEHQFNIQEFEFHHINQPSWLKDCTRKIGLPVVGTPILAVIKICGG